MSCVICDQCKKRYPAVFRGDARQGYGCATIRNGAIFTGHFGSEVADGSRYILQEGEEIPPSELFCDNCFKALIASGAVIESLDQEPVSAHEIDARSVILALFAHDQDAKWCSTPSQHLDEKPITRRS